jgi:RNA polymerase sigma-70 factor, ECF subfamily
MALLPDRRLGELEALYRARHSHFVRVARAITGDPERASEAVQDAFADAVRARARFRGDGALEAWVWRAVVNAARKSLRRPLVEARRAVDEQTAIELDAPPATRALAPRRSASRSEPSAQRSPPRTRMSNAHSRR